MKVEIFLDGKPLVELYSLFKILNERSGAAAGEFTKIPELGTLEDFTNKVATIFAAISSKDGKVPGGEIATAWVTLYAILDLIICGRLVIKKIDDRIIADALDPQEVVAEALRIINQDRLGK